MINQKPHLGVFLALTFCDEIYRDYPGINADLKYTPINNMIITLREDGYFGFLGGSADFGENEIQTLARECKEEGNLSIAWLRSQILEEDFVRVCEHTLLDGFKVILYHARITKAIAKVILKNSSDAAHFFTETAGLNSVAIHSKSSFAKNAFLSCMKEEFVELGKLIGCEVLIGWGTAH